MTHRLTVVPVLAVMVVLAACGSTTTSATPSASAPPISAPSASAPSASAHATTPASSPSGSGPAAGQTDTESGRIWDTLPADFPTIQGATPAEEGLTGPASAALVVSGDAAKTVTTSLRTSLEAAGFTTTAYSGPLEDGSYILELRGVPDDCKVQIVATPRGNFTTVTILYGAACPHT